MGWIRTREYATRRALAPCSGAVRRGLEMDGAGRRRFMDMPIAHGYDASVALLHLSIRR